MVKSPTPSLYRPRTRVSKRFSKFREFYASDVDRHRDPGEFDHPRFLHDPASTTPSTTPAATTTTTTTPSTTEWISIAGAVGLLILILVGVAVTKKKPVQQMNQNLTVYNKGSYQNREPRNQYRSSMTKHRESLIG